MLNFFLFNSLYIYIYFFFKNQYYYLLFFLKFDFIYKFIIKIKIINKNNK